MPDVHRALAAAALLAVGVNKPTAGMALPEERPLQRFALEVLEPPERGQVVRAFPVTLGLVFPDGTLRSAPGGRIVDDRGRAVPFEAEPTAWWSPEKDRIKWLLVHFRADTDRKYYFELGGQPERPAGDPIARVRDGEIVVATGPLQVRLPTRTPSLFGALLLNGQPMLRAAAPFHTLVADDGQAETPGKLGEWQAKLEEATPLRATIHASGYYRYPNGAPMARLELRYQFFQGESFVRVYHTLTWMVRDVGVGAREIALSLHPDLGETGTLRVGLSDYTSESWSTAWQRTRAVSAYQDAPDHLRITAAGNLLHEGKRLGGLLTMEGADGRSVSVSLRHPWQMYPTALAAADGALRVEFWPRQAPRMSFEFEALMPSEFYHSPVWKNFWWSKDAGHYVNEYAKRQNARGEISDNPNFLHTGEGAARTEELTFFFHDQSSSRTPAEINSVTQHPVILRQEPAAAMRVPFMGFQVEPRDAAHFPDLERATDLLGQMVIRRWASSHDYGFWRFGLVWWGDRQTPSTLYRWSDGIQYDQQLLPWMLFMRGGGREFYENGEILARFAMDVCTNHYNTRGCPTGYMGTAGGGSSFPFQKFSPANMKGQKIHFLAYYYHLTGYPRAKEVMDEVIAGTQKATLGFSDKPEGRVNSGREIFNMNVFWTNAYAETWDAAIKERARECLELCIRREYDPAQNTFRDPRVYLFNGLILQDQLWHDERLKGIMLRYLSEKLLGYEQDGGIRDVEATIACDWAFRQTGDARYARVGWDVCRQLADALPDMEMAGETAPYSTLKGNQLYRHFLGPILFNAGLGRRLGYRPDADFALRDTFFAIDPAAKESAPAEYFVRPHHDGTLKLRLLFVPAENVPPSPLKLRALGPDGTPLARLDVDQGPAELTLPALKQSSIYKLLLEASPRTRVLVLGDADVVRHIPKGHLFATASLAGQYYAGNRLYTRTTEEIVTFTAAAPQMSGYTIRDANTGELLFRSSTAQTGPVHLKLGQGRLICILGTGYPNWDRRSLEGVAPYFSTTREGWFDPQEGR